MLPKYSERLHRSLLSLPANNERFLVKAAASEADVIMIDLEDAVAPEQKVAARKQAVEAVDGLDWGNKTLLVRVNGLDTPWGYRDLIDVAEQAGRLDGVMVPKINTPRDVSFVDMLLEQIERATGREIPIAFEILVETAQGMSLVDNIAASGGRLVSISFGPGDYAASINNRNKIIGAPDPDYVIQSEQNGVAQAHWNDLWHYPLARLSTACHGNNLIPMDGVYVDFKDDAGLRQAARRAAALGYEGKWAIHPNQLPIINEVFAPREEEVAWASELMEVMDQAHGTGTGAVSVRGQMIDMAHVRQAQRVLTKARQITEKQTAPDKK